MNAFGSRATLETSGGKVHIWRLDALAKEGVAPGLSRLPVSIKVLVESVLRGCDGFAVTEEDVRRIARWNAPSPEAVEVPFKPARVLLQDFTGVPVLVDIAAMRAAFAAQGGDPKRINPLVPVDLVVDHSVQVDSFGRADSLAENVRLEFQRNQERYALMRWGQNAVDNFRAVPPATGIVHQVNLEFLAGGVLKMKGADGDVAMPDSCVGTDSHTTMVNGLGVLGWGVGGIEAEAVMLGQPLFMLTPQVVGFRLHGTPKEGVTATDVVLTVTQMLRKKGVVDKFVEFYGAGLAALTVADRATIANMAPEYGATCGFFPIDDETLAYLRLTARPKAHVDLVERYTKEQGLFRTASSEDPIFTDSIELDLGTVEPSLAGPKRPQDRVRLADMKTSFQRALRAPVKERGFELAETDLGKTVATSVDGKPAMLAHGSVVIAAITSCTNTSNPSVLIAAGLLARKARQKGLRVAPYVKTSLAPGSKVVTEYLRETGLLGDLEALGFNIVGYGCTTCIGNSGPLPEAVAKAVTDGKLVASAVLSGNRNFEGRVHPLVRAAYLASPPLVVAFALAGTTDFDPATQPIGAGSDGKPVFLRELWPSNAEVVETVRQAMRPELFERTYADVFTGDANWKAISGASGNLFPWAEDSTYIRLPPYFEGFGPKPEPIHDIKGARVLALLGDSITTDHISPAGDIAKAGPAAKYLESHGIQKVDFNSYGSRRGNHEVMLRGTFANVRLRNLLIPPVDGKPVEGGLTMHLPDETQLSIFDAAERYRADGVPLVILAGKEYGSGSSRDWAAKGTMLLGVRAVLAESYERIHRANLVGMGVLPLEFVPGQTPATLGLTGRETFDIAGLAGALKPRQHVTVRAERADGTAMSFQVIARLDTPVDIDYYRNGGILQTVLRKMMKVA